MKNVWDYIPPYDNWLPYLPFGTNCCGGFYKVMILAVLLIIAYSAVLAVISRTTKSNSDVLNKKIFDGKFFGGNCCSWWPITHFILFTILGMLFPTCDIPIILTGIVWEFFEELMGKILPEPNINYGHPNPNVQYKGQWWAGNVYDIFFNIAGFYFGKMIVTMRGEPFYVNGLNY